MVLKTGFPKIGISSAKYDTSITTCIQQFNLSDLSFADTAGGSHGDIKNINLQF